MDEQQLYEKQYGENKIIRQTSFPRLRKILRWLDVQRNDLAFELLEGGEKMLDLGCGDGELAGKALSKYQDVFGIDISASRIERAKKMQQETNRLHFSVANIQQGIPFEAGSFDAVTCIDVLEHVFDPYYLMSEMNRVLKINGVLIIEVPNLAYLRRRYELLTGQFPRTSSAINWQDSGWDGGHLHYFTYATFCELLKVSGFKILTFRSSGLLGRLKSYWPSLMAGSFCVKAVKA